MHDIPHPPSGLRVQPRGGLVEKKKFGTVDEPAGDIGATALSARKFAVGAFEKIAEFEQFGEFAESGLPIPVRNAVKRGAGSEVFPDAESVVEDGLLKDDTYTLLDFGGFAVEVESADFHLARGLPQRGAKYVYRRGLARPVQPEKRKKTPPLHRKGNALDCMHLAVILDEIFHADNVVRAACAADIGAFIRHNRGVVTLRVCRL